MHIERYIAARFLQSIPKIIMKEMDSDDDLKNQVTEMGQSLKLMGLQPWQVVSPRYGVPVAEEFRNQFPLFLVKRKLNVKQNIESQMESLESLLKRKLFEKQIQELELLKKIKKMTADYFTELTLT
jgi:heterodisulfide reductase subunit C